MAGTLGEFAHHGDAMPSNQRGPTVVDVSLQDAAGQILGHVRAALDELVRSTGADPSRPQDVARRFGLNKNLTWKVAKIVAATSPETIVTHLPGKPGMAILLRTLLAAGADEARVGRVRETVAAFDRFAEEHAGDRATLAMMLGAGAGQAQKEEATRKLAFQGNSATWGVQARVQHSAHFVLPPSGASNGRLDVAAVCGLQDLRRLRSDVAWPVAGVRVSTDDGKPLPPTRLVPMDPTVGPEEPPLLRKHCSNPLPPFRIRVAAGVKRFEIAGGGVGRTAAATCVVGRVVRGLVPADISSGDRHAEHQMNLITPVEVMIFDLFLHRDLRQSRHTPTMSVYGQLPFVSSYPSDGLDSMVIPVSESVQPLHPADLNVAELPRYREMLDEACSAAGVGMDQMVGHRFRLRFPPMPATAVFRYPIE